MSAAATKGGYTEDALVEQPAIALLEELGWDTFHAYSEFDHAGGAPSAGRRGPRSC